MSEEKAHAKFAPSSASRWLACPGSIMLSEHAPPQKDSKYSLEGTKAHTLLEDVLKEFLKPKGNPYTLIRKLRKSFDDQVMLDHVVNTFETIKKIIPHEGCEVLSETKSKCDFIHAEFGGTADAVIVEEMGRLYVIDFKYGAGVAVDAHDNEQMASYALGIAHKYKFNFIDCEMIIIQPRAEHRDGPVRSWVLTMEGLMSWEAKFRAGIEAALDPIDPQLIPGTGRGPDNHCHWCPAKPICPAVSTGALARARAEFSPIEGAKFPKIEGIQIAHLGPTLEALDALEIWAEGVREHAVQVLERGEKIDGWELVPTRAQRKWKDETKTTRDARQCFGPKAFETSLLSPARMEKVPKIGKGWVDARTVEVSSGMKLARITERHESPLFPAIQIEATVGREQPKKKGGVMAKKKTKRKATKPRATKKKTSKKTKRK